MVRFDGVLALNGIVDIGGLGSRGCQIQVGDAGAEIAMTPGELFAVRADIGPATIELQVNDFIAFRCDGDDAVLETHASVNGGHEPFAVRGPVQRIKMVEFLVGVLAGLTGFQIVNEQPFGGEIRQVVLFVFPLHIGNRRSVGAPARFAGIVRNLGALGSVDIHDIDVAHLAFAFFLVGDKAKLGTVR